MGTTVVDVRGGQVGDPAVAVFVVVPGEEPLAEGQGVFVGAEAVGEPGLVLGGLELALGVRVVVGDVGPAVALRKAEGGEQLGNALGDHGGAAVGVDRELAGVGMQGIKAQVPLAEMLNYAPTLNSITGGRGDFRMEFSHYEEVPAHIQQKIIEAAKKAKAGEETED